MSANTIPDDVMRVAKAIASNIPSRVSDVHRTFAASVIARAILAERNRCAAVAKSEGTAAKVNGSPQVALGAFWAARAILNPPSAASSRAEQAGADAAPPASAPAANSDWITWSGGKCPVDPETRVDVKHRRGEVSDGHRAIFWDGDPSWWEHKSGDRALDIIAYRIVPNLTHEEAQ